MKLKICNKKLFLVHSILVLQQNRQVNFPGAGAASSTAIAAGAAATSEAGAGVATRGATMGGLAAQTTAAAAAILAVMRPS